ncbi:MAG TPA: mannonate dehydratase [Candidatus Binatia bacterium]|nr:mannonate dehydratase [Candidatus Binatia bacterium]
MEETWRWFGPKDKVPLQHVKQAGATGIVTALHHVPNGAAWSEDEIARRKAEIEAQGLRWSVVESIPISEEIKTRSGDWKKHLAAYCESIRNLAKQGVSTVCYNFMPVIDWTRTDLFYKLPDGSLSLRFDATEFAAFDLFILQRRGAESEYTPERIEAARRCYEAMDDVRREKLTRTIIAGLPGAEESYTIEMLRASLDKYRGVSRDEFRDRLGEFLDAVTPVAEEAGVRLAIHPDDPPRSLLGLPRIVSTAADARWILDRVQSPNNGLTFCTGCYGVRPDNDLVAMAQEFADRIHFLHLRATKREQDPESFFEADHLAGDVDMVGVITQVLKEEKKRAEADRPDKLIPMRPDHGHQMLDDIEKTTNPGYSAIGRLRGLAELRGVATALKRVL